MRAQNRGKPRGSSDSWDRGYSALRTMTPQGISLFTINVFTTSKAYVMKVLSLGHDKPAWAVGSAWPGEDCSSSPPQSFAVCFALDSWKNRVVM